MSKWHDNVHAELKKGGSESPCPFCGVPRVQRSDYVRCCRCGINWMEGEALDQDPRTERQRKHLESVTATLSGYKGAKKEEPNGRR